MLLSLQGGNAAAFSLRSPSRKEDMLEMMERP